MNNHDRQEQQDRVFGALDVATAPIRAAKSIVQTVLIILLLVAIGVGYPIYLVCTGQPVTAISLVASGLTLLGIFTFIYTPYYFIFGGMSLAVAFTWGVCAHEDFMYAHNFNGWGLAWLFFGFLAFGVVQRFIRHRLFDPPKPPRDRRSPAERLFDYGDTGHAQLKASLSEGREHGRTECEDAYRVLGVENGADNASVKDAYRDLAKVWHPDRFGDDDTRLKKKAEEKFKEIKNAYDELQQRQPPASISDDFVEMPLKDAVEYCTALITEIGEKQSSAVQQIRASGRTGIHNIRSVVLQCLEEQQVAANHLQRLIRRFERETPEFSTLRLEAMQATIKAQKEQMTKLAVGAGIIQPR